MRYDFLIETYRTERLKTLSVWSQVPDTRMTFRPEPRARTPHEHMVHQCVSEDTWMRTMLGIAVSPAGAAAEERRQAFLEHYAAASRPNGSRSSSEARRVVRGRHAVLRRPPLARVGDDAPAHALVTPSRAAHRVSAAVGAGRSIPPTVRRRTPAVSFKTRRR